VDINIKWSKNLSVPSLYADPVSSFCPNARCLLFVVQPECVVVPVTASNPYNTGNKMQQKRRQRDHQTTVFSDSDEDST
jgi:hypothetical protein